MRETEPDTDEKVAAIGDGELRMWRETGSKAVVDLAKRHFRSERGPFQLT